MWPPTAFKRELQQNRLAQYIVVVEENPSAAPITPETPARQPGPFGRFLGELRHILAADEEESLPPPADRPELVIGFIGVWMLPDEAHIVTVAVRGSHRRQGIGELLVISAIEIARRRGQPMVTLECRITNDPALALYEKYGFERVGLRRRYYSDNQEDAYILTINSVVSRKFASGFAELRARHHERWGDFNFSGE
jgi:ribosomal-protein-alanine N-acetyltransferase